MTKFVATTRQIEVLAPNKAYAVTVILTKEKGGMMLVGGQDLPGETVDLTIPEVEQFISQRLNVEYDEEPERVDSSTQPIDR